MKIKPFFGRPIRMVFSYLLTMVSVCSIFIEMQIKCCAFWSAVLLRWVGFAAFSVLAGSLFVSAERSGAGLQSAVCFKSFRNKTLAVSK
jgi:hypothetical protein